jgi:hypothetical protein
MEGAMQEGDDAARWEVIEGDCVDVMRTMPEASVDAVVCDPPYNLSDSGKRDAQCLRRTMLEVGFPHDDHSHVQRCEGSHLAGPRGGSATLRWVDGTVRVDARIGVPEGAVDLKRASVGKQEVHDGDMASTGTSDRHLPLEVDAHCGETLGHYVLEPADGRDAPFCDTTCSCFTEPSAGRIAMDVLATGPAARLLTRPGAPHVGGRHDAGSQAPGAPDVVTGAGAVVRAVLCLDLLGGAHKLYIADGAAQRDPLFLLQSAEPVGTSSTARGLSSVTEAHRVSVIGASTHGTFALDAPWHALKPSRATGGFMGRRWDGWESPAAYQRWCAAWAGEALRVLKPGGHLLAFGGTRTYHRLTCALEDAGFEIRDEILSLFEATDAGRQFLASLTPEQLAALDTMGGDPLAWVYGSGFPKSLDVSKAVDKQDAVAERDARARQSQEWLRQHVTPQQVNEATGSCMGHILTTHPTQPAIPTPAMLDALRPLLPTVPSWLETLVTERRVESQQFAARELLRVERRMNEPSGIVNVGQGDRVEFDRKVTQAHTDDAKRWQGWGTALKPAHEPIVMARKPLSGTVAQTVLEHGTGALNIDGCRIGFAGAGDEAESKAKNRHADFDSGARENRVYGQDTRARGEHGNYDPPGRWPANLMLQHTGACVLVGTRRVRAATGPEDGLRASAGGNGVTHGHMKGVAGSWHAGPDGREDVEAWNCAPGCPIRLMDEQAPAAGDGRFPGTKGGIGKGLVYGAPGSGKGLRATGRLDPAGGASRFFYCAKASTLERNAGLEEVMPGWGRNPHP